MKRNRIVYNPVFDYILYSILLILTPFLMLRNYLQKAVSHISEYTISVAGKEIPLIFTLFIFVFLCFLIYYLIKKKKSIYHFVSFILVIVMIAIGQYLMDWYSDNPFYDLQNNWHYLAYMIYVYFAYRVYKRVKISIPIILSIYISGFILSFIDESFQYFISSRVFDISDIAKDGWGILIGLTILISISISNNNKDIFTNNKKIYFSLMFFNLVLMFLGSAFTEVQYFLFVLIISIFMGFIGYIILNLMKNRYIKLICILILAMFIIFIFAERINTKDSGFTHYSSGRTTYNGICYPYFDIIVFPDGNARIVDKKHNFNIGDRTRLLKLEPDILVISTGYENQGGKGFSDKESFFVFNPYTRKNTQVIRLNTKDAIEYYEKVKDIKKESRIAIVVHSTC